MVPTVMPYSDPVVDPEAEATSLVMPCSDPVVNPSEEQDSDSDLTMAESASASG